MTFGLNRKAEIISHLISKLRCPRPRSQSPYFGRLGVVSYDINNVIWAIEGYIFDYYQERED